MAENVGKLIGAWCQNFYPPEFANGWTYVGGGYVIIRAQGRFTDGEGKLFAKSVKWFDEMSRRAFVPYRPIGGQALSERCCVCGGMGWVVRCPECCGSGDEECPHCRGAIACKKCSGEGVVGIEEEKSDCGCKWCHGAGERLVPDSRAVDFGNDILLGIDYVWLVQRLPGPIEWSLPDLSIPLTPLETRVDVLGVAFRGPGWEAIIARWRRVSGQNIVMAQDLYVPENVS